MEIIHEELATTIIGAAIKVHKYFGLGFIEKVYEGALEIELKKIGLKAERQKELLAYYDNEVVGKFYADILVEDKIIIEMKAVSSIDNSCYKQLYNYLNVSNKQLGLLLNFGESRLTIKRIANTMS